MVWVWGWYDRGLALLLLLDWCSVVCCVAMVGIYWELLARIVVDFGLVMRGRLSLFVREKLWVVGRSLARVGDRCG